MNEDLLSIVRTRSSLSQMRYGSHPFEPNSHTELAQRFIECWDGGILTGIRDNVCLTKEMMHDALNTYQQVAKNWSDPVLSAANYWDAARFFGRQPSRDEPLTYGLDLSTRAIANLHFMQEVILKEDYNVIVLGGVLESNPGFQVSDLDFTDGANAEEPVEVRRLKEAIRNITLEEVRQHPKSLSDVINVGANVSRTKLGRFNSIELQMAQDICILSHLFMLPEHPNEDDIDYDISYFGRQYEPPRRWKFDALQLFAMMTGRTIGKLDGGGIVGWGVRRGVKIRSRRIVQKDVSSEDSTRICIHLHRLAIRLRDHVNGAEEASESASESEDDEDEAEDSE